MRRALALAAFAVSLAATGSSRAADSRNGPLYIQGVIPGYNYWSASNGFGRGSWNAWRPDFEFGIHFTGRHDGFVLGFRQAFLLTALPDDPGGTTVVKLGYDIPIPIKKFELVVGPYATIGVGYLFNYGGRIGLQTGFFGADVKFFIMKGFYAFARPPEFGMQCFHDAGGGCFFQTLFGAGVGYAFPHPGG